MKSYFIDDWVVLVNYEGYARVDGGGLMEEFLIIYILWHQRIYYVRLN